MSDKGLMIGWEFWWATEFAKQYPRERQQKAILADLCEKHFFKRSEAYEKRKTVKALLDPELAKCDGDLFALIARILADTPIADNDSLAVAEVDLDTGETTKLEGWDDALEASLQTCEFDEHPAHYLRTLIEILEAERTRIESERKRLNERLSAVNDVLELFRGRGRPEKIPDDTVKPSKGKGRSARK
jgi:hypothetical protein